MKTNDSIPDLDASILAHHALRARFPDSHGVGEDFELYADPTPFAAEAGTELQRLIGALRAGQKLQLQLAVRSGAGAYTYEGRVLCRADDGETSISFAGTDLAHVFRRLRRAVVSGNV